MYRCTGIALYQVRQPTNREDHGSIVVGWQGMTWFVITAQMILLKTSLYSYLPMYLQVVGLKANVALEFQNQPLDDTHTHARAHCVYVCMCMYACMDGCMYVSMYVCVDSCICLRARNHNVHVVLTVTIPKGSRRSYKRLGLLNRAQRF